MSDPDRDRIEALERALRTALEKWREADYHWTLEFEEVPDTWQEWRVSGEFAAIEALLKGEP